MPKKPSLPPNTNVCRNPYRTKSGYGKFYSARIGMKVTGSRPIYQRFATEAEAYRWVLQKVEEYARIHAEHGKAARQMTPQQYSCALLTWRELGEVPPDLILDLAKTWSAMGKPPGLQLGQLRSALAELKSPSVTTISEAVEFYESHSPEATQVRTVKQVIEEWLRAKGWPTKTPKKPAPAEDGTLPENAAPSQPLPLTQGAGSDPQQEETPRRRANDYIRGIRSVARKLIADFGERNIHEITADEMKSWLEARPYAANTRRHYHKDLRTVAASFESSARA